MTTLEPEIEIQNRTRAVLVDAPLATRASGEASRKPKTIARLSDWQYIERSLHRIIAGWGRHFWDWADVTACHRHIWEQAECVRRLRDRLEQFPGAAQHLDAPVSQRLERLANAVLLAPSFHDAIDGAYGILMPALTRSYQEYGATAHPIHDAPTIAVLHEIVGQKEGMRLWRADFRRRFPHTTNPEYAARIRDELAACGDLLHAVPIENEEFAAPVGVNTDFKQPAQAGLSLACEPGGDIKPFLARDFSTSVEARRLFWCYGYLLEMGLAMDQLRWVYAAHDMPWAFVQDASRHLWDESRHGDSGRSRLLDFGITLADLGFPTATDDSLALEGGTVEAMTPHERYEAVFHIGMVAETGHFGVKRQAYDDFAQGGDLESAEMMLFDIIDETTHVQYAHRWLPLLAERAGVDNSDYRERAFQKRARAQENHLSYIERVRAQRHVHTNPGWTRYEKLLAIMREKQPLSNAQSCPPRDPLPM